MRIYPFEKNKFYIILADPKYINLEELISSAKVIPEQLIILSCTMNNEYLRTIEFDTINEIEDWVKYLKSAP